MNTTDTAFGPQLGQAFDFTLYFEQTILSILPSTLLLAVSALRIGLLARRKPGLRAGPLLWIKFIPIVALFALQITNLALWSLSSVSSGGVAIAAASLALIDVLAMGFLLYAEHRFSRSPSLLLGIYLTITILLDVAIIRSLFLRGNMTAIGAVTSAALAAKILILILEEIPKRGSTSRELSGGLWNRSAFWWLNSTFRKGFKSFIGVDELFSVDKHLESRHVASNLGNKWKSADKANKNCLALATFGAFQATFWAAVIPRLCFTGFGFAQPFLIHTIIEMIGSGREISRGEVGGIIGATALVYFGIAFSKAHYKHYTFRFITQIRGGLVALIFGKAIELDAATAKDTAAVTLMSTDIDGIAAGVTSIHDVWASVIELGIGLYLLQRQVGPACVLFLIPAVLTSFATGRIARGMGPARAYWNAQVQKRVSTTSSSLDQIKGIKMMGLSGRVADLIQSLRVSELESSKKFRMFIIWLNMAANLSDHITPVIIIAAAVFWTQAGENLSVAQAFTSLSIIALVSTPLVNIIAAYPLFVSGLACFNRIQDFLLSTERKDYRSPTAKRSSPEHSADSDDIELQVLPGRVSKHDPVIQVKMGSFALKDGREAILKDVDFTIARSSLTMIVGPVASGKSTLLKALLGEAKLLSGQVQLASGPLAYCDQTAWLRWGTIRDNIQGPNDFDEAWYREVLRACALEEDIAGFESGDQSLVGSAGVALSGGQKQRVALARAVYARASVVFLDDIFSALDSQTSVDVFNNLFGHGGILRRNDIAVLLATHAVRFLPFADRIMLLDDGGTIVQHGTYDELWKTERFVKIIGSQTEAGTPSSSDSEGSSTAETSAAKAPTPAAAFDLTRKTGDLSLYKFYLRSVGRLLFTGWIFIGAGYIFSSKIPQIWLRIWTERGTMTDTAAYFSGYVGFGLLCVLFSGFCLYYFMILVIPKSAQNLHRLLLDAALRAPLWFFTSTDTSTLVNRFSQDMTLVDQVLPVALLTTTFDVFNVLAGAALVASGATYVAAIMPLCIAVIYAIQKYYLRTSRQMRHLDLEAKSPLYRLFSEAAAGITTIRAFGWTEHVVDEHFRQLDHSQKPYYMMYCIQRWLNVVLDLIVAGIAVVLVGFALGFSNTATQGSIGLAMLNVMEFSQSLSMLITSWTGLETSLGAIARLKSFLAETKSESQDGEDDIPPLDWPQRGSIELHGVTAKYNASDEQSQPALRDVSLDLRSGQNILVVGRTGSGKSSLLLTLLHLLDYDGGRITVDGLDLSRLSREALRSRIVTIPQDAVELPGSVRFNLGQFAPPGSKVGEAGGDQGMQRALIRVGLWDAIASRGGLDAELDDVSLSGGQKQLFSLARAILSKQGKTAKGAGVVLLDEPTSSMGDETDVLMRQVVTEEFAGYTIVTVSHRLDAAKDADVVVRMAGGRVVELTQGGE